MALTAYARLVLLRIKIERAKQHFRDLERVVIASRDKHLHVLLPNEEPQPGATLTRLPVYPFEILSIAGDVVHGLRSSLDHLAYQLAIVGSGETPTRRVEFPIAKDRDTYEAEKARKVEGIRPEAVEAIDRLSPYKGGNDVLWRIHELDNIDKHRFVFVIAKDALFDAPWYAEERPYLIRPRTLNTDAPLFSGVFDSEVENDVNFEIEKAVSKTQVAESDALLPALRHYINVVENLIFSFEPHLS